MSFGDLTIQTHTELCHLIAYMHSTLDYLKTIYGEF